MVSETRMEQQKTNHYNKKLKTVREVEAFSIKSLNKDVKVFLILLS